MKLIFDHVGKYRAASILSPVFKLLEACFELTVPLIVAGVIDNGIKMKDMDYVWSHVPILVLFAIVGFVSAITAQYFAAYAACGISSDIRKSLHDKIQTLSVSDYEKIGSSGIVTLLTSDVNQIQTGINLFLRLLLRSPFIVIGACIMAAVVKPSMALIFAGCTLILAVVIALNMKFSIARHKEAREGLDDLVIVEAEVAHACGRENRRTEGAERVVVDVDVVVIRVAAHIGNGRIDGNDGRAPGRGEAVVKDIVTNLHIGQSAGLAPVAHRGVHVDGAAGG